MFCQHCGKQIEEGSRFCKYCGIATGFAVPAQPAAGSSAQGDPAPAVQPPGRKSNMGLVIAGALAGLAVLAAAGGILAIL